MLSLSGPTSSYEAVRKIFSICQVRVTDILLPAQLGDSAAGPVHQPMQGGLPSVDEEVLLPWEIIARINCEYSSGDRARLGQNSEGIKKFNIQHNILLVCCKKQKLNWHQKLQQFRAPCSDIPPDALTNNATMKVKSYCNLNPQFSD